MTGTVDVRGRGGDTRVRTGSKGGQGEMIRIEWFSMSVFFLGKGDSRRYTTTISFRLGFRY